MTPRRRLIWLGAALAIGVALLGIVGRYRVTRPEYRFRQGLRAAQTGDLVRAQHYAEILQLAGASDWANLLLGEARLAGNDPVGALSALNTVNPQGPVHLDAALVSARCLIALRRQREAEQLLHYVAASRPKDADARRWLAVIYFDQGNLTWVLPLLREVAALDPADGRPHRLIGLIYKDLGQWDDSVEAYRESLKRDPGQPGVDELKLEFAAALLKRGLYEEVLALNLPAHSPNSICVQAEALIGIGQYDEATAMLDAGLQRSTEHSGLLRLRAERYRVAGMIREAIPLFEKVAKLEPQDDRSHLHLMQCYSILGNSKQAAAHEKELRRLRALAEEIQEHHMRALSDPWNVDARQRLADLFTAMGDPNLAKMWAKAAEACRFR